MRYLSTLGWSQIGLHHNYDWLGETGSRYNTNEQRRENPRISSILDHGTRKKTVAKLIHVNHGPEKGLNVNKELHCVVDAGCWHWYRRHWRYVAVQQREDRSTKYRRCLISSPIYSNGVKFNKAAEWHWLSLWPSNIRVAKAPSHTTMFARHRLHFAPADTAREPTKFASSLHRSNRTSPNRHLTAPSTPRAPF